MLPSSLGMRQNSIDATTTRWEAFEVSIYDSLLWEDGTINMWQPNFPTVVMHVPKISSLNMKVCPRTFISIEFQYV